jgi:hypothetical protein
MTTINFNDFLIGFNGKPLQSNDGNTTLKDICQAVLWNPALSDGLANEEKYKRYVLSVKINTNQVVEITDEEVILLKDLIGKGYGPLIVGLAWDKLDAKM